MRPIDADALGVRMYYEVFGKDSTDHRWDSGCWIRYRLFEKMLKEAPTIEERKTGKWIGGELGNCSVCGHEGCASDIWDRCAHTFCPNCGSKLEVEHERFSKSE